MAFWIGILIALLFAYSATKLGFFQTWAMLFNVVVAVYLAIRLSPAVRDFVPMQGDYCGTLCVLGTGVGTFLILHGLSHVFFVGQFEVGFPTGFSTLGAGAMGFLAGFLVWSFAALVICTTPFCENAFVKEVGFDSKGFQQAKMQSYLIGWCSFVDKLVLSADGASSAEAIEDLLRKPAAETPAPSISAKDAASSADVKGNYEPNSPNRPAGQPPPEPPPVIPP